MEYSEISKNDINEWAWKISFHLITSLALADHFTIKWSIFFVFENVETKKYSLQNNEIWFQTFFLYVQ